MNASSWKLADREEKDRRNSIRKQWRHKTGLSTRFNGKGTKERRARLQKLYSKARKARERGGGKLTRVTVQRVYEDNIKNYGTLTCYLCIQPIVFGNDNLEHILALSNGGDNSYCNLAVACAPCNKKKGAQ